MSTITTTAVPVFSTTYVNKTQFIKVYLDCVYGRMITRIHLSEPYRSMVRMSCILDIGSYGNDKGIIQMIWAPSDEHGFWFENGSKQGVIPKHMDFVKANMRGFTPSENAWVMYQLLEPVNPQDVTIEITNV